MKVRHADLHKENKSIREGISESKTKSFISLFLDDLITFKIVTATIYWMIMTAML